MRREAEVAAVSSLELVRELGDVARKPRIPCGPKQCPGLRRRRRCRSSPVAVDAVLARALAGDATLKLSLPPVALVNRVTEACAPLREQARAGGLDSSGASRVVRFWRLHPASLSPPARK